LNFACAALCAPAAVLCAGLLVVAVCDTTKQGLKTSRATINGKRFMVSPYML
jgi:hypothetical protein